MTNQLIKKINLNHSFIFFLLINLFSVVMFKFNYLDISSSICLFLILTIGVSHGALDNVKGKKLLKLFNFERIYVFYIFYIFIAVCVIIIWSLLPATTLLVFLIVAAFHFGKEDTQFLINKKSYLIQLLYLLKGSLIILAPLFFHFDETLKIFETLMVNKTFLTFLELEHWIINFFLFLSFIGYLYFANKNKFEDFEVLFLDMLSIVILNYIFSPIIAFTVYFCFLHSIRHIISLSNELDKNDFSNGVKIFIKKALPLTVVTAILYLVASILLSKSFGLNDVIIKAIFIGLASLTFPHILLEYLLEINEKRN